MTSPLACTNCGAQVSDVYCGHCGQRRGDLHHPLRELGGELLEEFLHWDSRILRTLIPLFVKPGFLTLEYWRGRRASYARPLQLYLVATFVFFAALGLGLGRTHVSLVNFGDGNEGISPKDIDPLPPHPSYWERLMHQLEVNVSQHGMAQVQRDSTSAMVEDMPKAMFLLLPLAALLLRIAYWRQPRYYAEHFVLALHLHAFVFFLMAASLPLPKVVGDVLQLAMLPYFFIALRRVFGQGWGKTIIKMFAAGFLYLVAVTVVTGAVVMWRLAPAS